MICKFCNNEIPENSIFCNWCGGRQIRETRKKPEIKVPKARQLPSGRWNIQLRRERCSVTEDTAEKATAKAAAIRAGFISAGKSAPAYSDVTLGKAIDAYIDSRSNILSPSTIKAYRGYCVNHFTGLMERSINSITVHDVQNAVNEEICAMCKDSGRGGVKKNDHPVSGKTVVNAYGLVRRVLSLETDLDLRNIVLPQYTMDGGKTLTPEQIGTLIRAVQGDNVEVPVLLSVWLGLRRSEIAALRKSDFDFENKTVSIHCALVQDDQNRWVEKGTKTRSSNRTLPCPEYILSRAAALPDGRVLNVHPNYLYVKLRRICDEYGLPRVRFHDLRHCAASVMLLLGVPDKYAMERGGWATKRTMSGRYQHTIEGEARVIGDNIDKYYLSLIEANENTNEIKNGPESKLSSPIK